MKTWLEAAREFGVFMTPDDLALELSLEELMTEILTSPQCERERLAEEYEVKRKTRRPEFVAAVVDAMQPEDEPTVAIEDPIRFYESPAWKWLRWTTLKKYGFRCQACGRSRVSAAVIHVDHIKPRSKFPELELDPDNLQVLCEDCNLGKSNRDQTDCRVIG